MTLVAFETKNYSLKVCDLYRLLENEYSSGGGNALGVIYLKLQKNVHICTTRAFSAPHD